MSVYGTHSGVWGVDTEWGFHGGLVDHESAFEPVVFCAVEYRGNSRLSFWGRDPGLSGFLAEHADDLFVAHNATAEMRYLIRVGVPLPTYWYDTMIEERYCTSRRFS